jgi:single-strand DNA-binding protein
VCALRIAHNDRRKVNGDWTNVAQFFDVTVWGKLGEAIARDVAKGQKVVIGGRLQWREYEAEGGKRQVVDITADSVVPVTRNGNATPAADEDFVPASSDEDIPF